DFGTGIRVATPTNALTAMTLAMRQGVLVKGAQYLERLSRADVVIFDKTGTLTEGVLELVDVAPVGQASMGEVLSLSASAGALVAHPIAEAIRRAAEQKGLAVPQAERGSVQYGAGRGVQATVNDRCILVGNARWMDEHRIDLKPAQPVLERHRSLGASS